MIGILICDDDPGFLKQMRTAVDAFFRQQKLRAKIYTCSNGQQIDDQVLLNTDIALLDVDFENQDYNGLDVARTLRCVRSDAVILFVTDYVEYAPEGYAVQAFRYILKRNLDTDLIPCLTLAVSHRQTVCETFKFRTAKELFTVPLSNILYFEVCQHNVTISLTAPAGLEQKTTFSFYAKLSDLEAQLSQYGFLRVHKSYLVNMRHIISFQCREILLVNGDAIRSSEKNYGDNKRKFLLWKGWNQ